MMSTKSKAIVLLLALFCGFKAYKSFVRYQKERAEEWDRKNAFTPIEPSENADGTIDYSVVRRAFRSSSGSYWVLRFPRTALVEPTDPLARIKDLGITFTNTEPPNQGLQFYVGLQDFVPLPKATPDIIYGAKPDTFKVIIERGMAPFDGSKSTALDVTLEKLKLCRPTSFVEPGVAVYDGGLDVLEGCRAPFPKTETGYIVADKAGIPVSSARCGHNADAKPNGEREETCSAWIDLIPNREFYVLWSTRHFDPTLLQSWVLRLTELVSKSTVRFEIVPPNVNFKP